MSEEHIVEFENTKFLPLLYGEHNAHLRHIEDKLKIKIADRGNVLALEGDKGSLKKAQKILASLWDIVKKDQNISLAEIDAALRFANNGSMSAKNDIVIKTKKKTIAPRSPTQAKYLKAIEEHDMVFGLGPAGTGKTYLAVAMGVSLYLQGKVERLIFTRPAVEAGEQLGFLPGDMQEKVDPYLRPIYDALQDMLPRDFTQKKMEAGEIEVAPLAFMRGRTLANAFVILDEAQNTTATQMKMFLTRMGESTRMVVTGDQTQTDLPRGLKSGLVDAMDTLQKLEEVEFVQFTGKDVVRHSLVRKIVEAYEKRS